MYLLHNNYHNQSPHISWIFFRMVFLILSFCPGMLNFGSEDRLVLSQP